MWQPKSTIVSKRRCTDALGLALYGNSIVFEPVALYAPAPEASPLASVCVCPAARPSASPPANPLASLSLSMLGVTLHQCHLLYATRLPCGKTFFPICMNGQLNELVGSADSECLKNM